MNETAQVSVYQSGPPPMSAHDIRAQVNLIQEVMREVMKKDEHYGAIPGTGGKPTLLKPGAEKLIMTFRLVPHVDVKVIHMLQQHREYQVSVRLSTLNGTFLGEGVGACSTMEAKYRYRWKRGEKVEHDNPPDHFNTALKMAKKRALVDAVLTVTAASDIFTQDIEDHERQSPEQPPPQQPTDMALGDSLPDHSAPPAEDKVENGVDELLVRIAGIDSFSGYNSFTTKAAFMKQLSWLGEHRADLHQKVVGALGELTNRIVREKAATLRTTAPKDLDAPTPAADDALGMPPIKETQ